MTGLLMLAAASLLCGLLACYLVYLVYRLDEGD